MSVFMTPLHQFRRKISSALSGGIGRSPGAQQEPFREDLSNCQLPDTLDIKLKLNLSCDCWKMVDMLHNNYTINRPVYVHKTERL